MRFPSLKLPLLSLILLLSATDCSSDSDNNDPMDTDDAGLMCPSAAVDVQAPVSCTGNYTAIIRGSAQDQGLQPLDAVLAQMCIDDGTDSPKCLNPIATCSPGYFEIPLEEVDRCLSSAVVHMIPMDSARFASTFCNLEFSSTPSSDLTVDMPFTSFALQAPTDLPPLGTASSTRTVTFAGGIEVDVVPGRYFGAGPYADLGSRTVSSGEPVPCGADGQDFDGIVAFGPAGNIQDPGNPVSAGFDLRIPADGLVEGATVELFVQGSLDCQLEDGTRVKEAEWRKFGEGTVDANGMIAGARLPCFSWLAWRAL